MRATGEINSIQRLDGLLRLSGLENEVISRKMCRAKDAYVLADYREGSPQEMMNEVRYLSSFFVSGMVFHGVFRSELPRLL